MKRYFIEIILGVLLVVFWFWHSPIGKLSQPEIDQYMASIEKNAFPPEDMAQALANLRAWAEADDGEPVFMLNLMRNYDHIRHYPGAPDFKGTPAESNKLYEEKAIPLLFKRSGYPLILGFPQFKNLIGFDPAVDNWSEVISVRYPCRRAFLSLLADPAYAPYMPHKLMACQLNLTPLSGSIIIPDLRWIFTGLFIMAILALGWRRAVKKNQK